MKTFRKITLKKTSAEANKLKASLVEPELCADRVSDGPGHHVDDQQWLHSKQGGAGLHTGLQSSKPQVWKLITFGDGENQSRLAN